MAAHRCPRARTSARCTTSWRSTDSSDSYGYEPTRAGKIATSSVPFASPTIHQGVLRARLSSSSISVTRIVAGTSRPAFASAVASGCRSSVRRRAATGASDGGAVTVRSCPATGVRTPARIPSTRSRPRRVTSLQVQTIAEARPHHAEDAGMFADEAHARVSRKQVTRPAGPGRRLISRRAIRAHREPSRDIPTITAACRSTRPRLRHRTASW